MPSGIRRRRVERSSNNRATRKRREKRTKSKDISANPIVAANWDRDQTLTQNYRRLGLTSKLGKPTGGVENDVRKRKASVQGEIKRSTVREGQIVHNADGSTSIVYKDEDDLDEAPVPAAATSSVVTELEAYAAKATTDRRHQSAQESEWLAALVAKYGDDYAAMQWDKKLNKFQQSAGDIKRRLKKWQAAGAS